MIPFRPFKLAFVLLFLVSLPGLVQASAPVRADVPDTKPKMVITLEDAVRIGMKENRDLEIARLDRDMARQKVRESWSEVLPHLSSSFSYTRSLKPTVMFFPVGAFTGGDPNQVSTIRVSQDNAYMGSVNLNQTLFKLSAFAGIKAASLVKKISAESYRNVNAEVVTSIRKAYFDALIAVEKLKLVDESISRWEQSRRDTNALFRQGVVADLDTLKAYLSVENLRPDLIRARSNVSISATNLKSVMGIDQNTEVTLLDALLFHEMSSPSDVFAAYTEAVEQRPDVRSLSLQLDAEDEKVMAARSEGLPSLGAFGQIEAQTQFNDGKPLDKSRWPVSSSVGLQLSMPIFSGFGTSAKIEQAKISRLQTRTRLEDLKARVRADVEIRLSNLAEARKRIEVQSKTISVAERSYRITRLRLREGIGSLLELTDAELQLNTAKTNYLQAVYDYLVASVELEKSLGRIVPADRKS
jgi:outer membrane protein TolC